MPKPCSEGSLSFLLKDTSRPIRRSMQLKADCWWSRRRERELKLRCTCCLFPYVGVLTLLLMNSSSALGQSRGKINKIYLSHVYMNLISKLLGI